MALLLEDRIAGLARTHEEEDLGIKQRSRMPRLKNLLLQEEEGVLTVAGLLEEEDNLEEEVAVNVVEVKDKTRLKGKTERARTSRTSTNSSTR